jgi:hypothetical protein
LLLHIGLHALSLAVDGIEFASEALSGFKVLAQQAFNAKANVLEATRCIDARPNRKAKICDFNMWRMAPSHAHQGANARLGFSLPNSLQTSIHQSTIVSIKLDQVGHGPKCDKIKQLL